jgi:methylmalonyl-CoA mutase
MRSKKASLAYLRKKVDALIGKPGEFPFVRGPYETMYTSRPWTIRQYSGFSTVNESNAFYRRNLAGGQQGLSIAFDLPTHRGYDSDHERVRGDVGMAGVAVDSIHDMVELFDGIPLDKVSVSMTMNGAVMPIMAMYIVAAERQGCKQTLLSGTLQNDILKEFMVRNTFIYPPEPSMRIVGDIIRYCSINMPKFNPISISGYHIQEAGATTVQELAFTLADGLEYVRTGIKAGIKPEQFCHRLSFFWGIGMNFFAEIAKMRAARSLWAELLIDKFSISKNNPKALLLRTHCQTSGWSLAATDPLNNVVRTTIEAMSAVFGGTQSLHTNSFDEAIGLPTDLSARVARNTQLILQNECDFTQVIDPLGGSVYIESLTEKIKQEASELINQVEELGGMLEAVKAGFPQRLISQSASERQAQIDSGKEVIIGVNRFINPHPEQDQKLFPIRIIENAKIQQEQIENLQKMKGKRDQKKVEEALKALEKAARDEKAPLMERVLEAARVEATVGEISQAFENVWGRYNPKTTISSGAYKANLTRNDKDLLDKAIEASKQFEKDHGRRPRILVAKVGQDGHDRGAKVIAGAFVDVGFDVDLGPLFATPKEVVRMAIDSDVHVLGISSLAAGHRTLVPEIINELKREGVAGRIIVVCGGVIPESDHQLLKSLGVQAIYGPGTILPEAAIDLIKLANSQKQK